jgi:hypothetical protein
MPKANSPKAPDCRLRWRTAHQPDASDTRLTSDEAERISKLIARLPELVELEKDRDANA